MVVATVPVVIFPLAVAITPDRSHAYVVNNCSSNKVSVIATASNTVVATVTVGSSPIAIAITPDGKHAYVTNAGSNTVSVIATASNAVVATVAVESFSYGVGISRRRNAWLSAPSAPSLRSLWAPRRTRMPLDFWPALPWAAPATG
jgi:YVTN family beta-propeller protein